MIPEIFTKPLEALSEMIIEQSLLDLEADDYRVLSQVEVGPVGSHHINIVVDTSVGLPLLGEPLVRDSQVPQHYARGVIAAENLALDLALVRVDVLRFRIGVGAAEVKEMVGACGCREHVEAIQEAEEVAVLQEHVAEVDRPVWAIEKQ